MDTRQQSTIFKQFSPKTNFNKILGVKLSSDAELIESSDSPVNLTIATAGQIYLYRDLQNTFQSVRLTEPLSLTRLAEE